MVRGREEPTSRFDPPLPENAMTEFHNRRSRTSTIRALVQFYGFYGIHVCVRPLRINWGILEEMRRQQASFLVTCRWPQILYCLFAFQKHKIPVAGNFSWDSEVGFIEKLGYRLRQTPENPTSEEWDRISAQQFKVPQLWVPVNDVSFQGFSILKLVQLAQIQKKIILPVSCSMPSSFVLSSSTGMRFPYPFSKVVLLMDNPIKMENAPVEQACLQVQHALDHLDEMAHAMLQKMNSN